MFFMSEPDGTRGSGMHSIITYFFVPIRILCVGMLDTVVKRVSNFVQCAVITYHCLRLIHS